MISPTIFRDAKQLHESAAEHWIRCCSEAITRHGSFHVALSGGTTPKALFQLLASNPYVTTIPWDKIHFYFVPKEHNDSNFKMASDAMLSKIPCNPQQIYAVDTSLVDAATAAAAYEQLLKDKLPKDPQGVQHFDLVLLGLGPDGHTASLFPDTAALTENNKTCTAVYVEKFKSWRITITFPVINLANNILLMSEGAGKADIIKELLINKKDTLTYPVQRIEPQGNMLWYVDKAAAEKLTNL